MSDPLATILAVVTTFSQAASTRDVAALERALSPTAVQHVRMGENWTAMPTSLYLQLMTDKKIGGEPVILEVHEVSQMGAFATVHATRTTPSLRFDDLLTLTASGSSWQIVGAAVVVSPVQP